MKALFHRILNSHRAPVSSASESPVSVSNPRQGLYREAAMSLAANSRPGFIREDRTYIEVAAVGIIDGWVASPAYDPEIAISKVVQQAIMLHADSLRRYESIWDRENAVITCLFGRRTETRIVIHAGRDLSWCWEHNCDLPRHLREIYGACVGMGIAYGLSLGKSYRHPRTDWELRPLVRKGFVEGAYAKTKGIFEKRSGLFDMELTESEWLARKAA